MDGPRSSSDARFGVPPADRDPASDLVVPSHPDHALATRLMHDGAYAISATALALVLLWYIHSEWQWLLSVACGLLSGIVVRRTLAPSFGGAPRFLDLPFSGGVVWIGTCVSVLSTLGFYPLPYWILVWRETTAIAASVAVVATTQALLVSTYHRMAREIEAHRLRESELEKETIRAQLRALQAQINPHFLFNALNSLAELTRIEPETAEEMVEDLAHLFRYTLRASADSLVPIEQEMTLIERYLRVERVRLGERLRVDLEVDSEVERESIPGLSLQPLVENAVHYAVATRTEGGTITVRAYSGEDTLILEVQDDGPGIPSQILESFRIEGSARLNGSSSEFAGPRGTGGAGGALMNVRRRLELVYSGRASIVPRNHPEGGAHVVIRIPK